MKNWLATGKVSKRPALSMDVTEKSLKISFATASDSNKSGAKTSDTEPTANCEVLYGGKVVSDAKTDSSAMLSCDVVDLVADSSDKESCSTTAASFIDKFMVFRQKSLDHYVEAGGSVSNFKPTPAMYDLDPSNHQFPFHKQRPMLCTTKLCPSALRFREGSVSPMGRSILSNGSRYQAHVTCVRFNQVGDLFAVCSTNGIIRIFDFAECETKLQQLTNMSSGARFSRRIPNNDWVDEECIAPCLVLDCKRDIVDLCWKPHAQEDQILVTYLYHFRVHVYDLIDHAKPAVDPEFEHHTFQQVEPNNRFQKPLYVLTLTADRAHGGHTCALYLHFKDAASTSTESHVVAGSTMGHVRCWVIDGRRPFGYSFLPIWEINADPYCPSSMTVNSVFDRVVGLKQIHEKFLVCITTKGKLSVWDLENFSAQSFGSKDIPMCLSRFDVNLERPSDRVLSIVDVPSCQDSAAGEDSFIRLSLSSTDIILVNVLTQSVTYVGQQHSVVNPPKRVNEGECREEELPEDVLVHVAVTDAPYVGAIIPSYTRFGSHLQSEVIYDYV